ncbi:MAG: 50S ribosomal protein L29 [Verrucomicrobiota bacterium]
MKVEDIRELDRTELETRVRELKEEQFKLRFRASMMQIENPSLVRKIRRDIARIKTVLRERELAQKG